jgi:hypothetical protein
MSMVRLIMVNVTSLAFGVLAAVLAVRGFDGWGWFLVPSILTLHVMKEKR